METEGVQVVRFGEGKDTGVSYSSLSVPREDLQETWRGTFYKGVGPRANGFELTEERFRLNIMKKFFIVMVVKHCNRLPRDLVNVPSLEMFKVKMDEALIILN